MQFPLMTVFTTALFLGCVATTSGNFFQQFFGGEGGQVQFDFGGGFGGRRRSSDANVEVSLSLADFYKGRNLTLNLQRQAVCETCKGSGAKSEKKCGHCKGKGVVRHPFHPIQQHCPHCSGTGKTIAEKCPVCHGKKVHRENRANEAYVPPGSPDGYQVRLQGMADEAPGVEPGDVLVNFKATPHPTFAREDLKLKTTVPISLGEALLGFTREITHLDEHSVVLRRSEVTQHGSKEVVIGEGMPGLESSRRNRGKRGDLDVTYLVKHPKRLTPMQIESLRKLYPVEFQAIEEAWEQSEDAEDVEDASADDADHSEL